MRNVFTAILALLLTSGIAHAQNRRFREFHNTSPKAGEKAPEFKGLSEEENTVTLSEFKGKKHVVLIFGAIT